MLLTPQVAWKYSPHLIRKPAGSFPGFILFSATRPLSVPVWPQLHASRQKKSGKPLVRVIAQGGDGGTTDIGFGCLSGMFERNDDVLYICYDNEGYMNTGVQRSSATPPAVRTATTQIVANTPATPSAKGKDVPLIAMAHAFLTLPQPQLPT
mgnify:CR=1 FL=1